MKGKEERKEGREERKSKKWKTKRGRGEKGFDNRRRKTREG